MRKEIIVWRKRLRRMHIFSETGHVISWIVLIILNIVKLSVGRLSRNKSTHLTKNPIIT